MASSRTSSIPTCVQTSPGRNSTHRTLSSSAVAQENLRSLILSLSPDDLGLLQSTFNVDHVLQDLRCNKNLVKNPLMFERLNAAIGHFQPFFAAIDTGSQTDPMHFGVAWAGLRVIIQVLTNLSTFFEKVVSSLEAITTEMAYFSRVRETVSKLPNLSEPIKYLLDKAYEQLLLYLTGLIRLFYRSTGERKDTPIILARAMWKPFRLNLTLETFKDLRAQLRDEITLLNLNRSPQAANASTARDHQRIKESRQAFSSQVRGWLRPPMFQDSYDNSLQRRASGTSKWLWTNASFSSWYTQSEDKEGLRDGSEDGSEADSNPPFWVYGKPGAGKTVLAASLIKQLKNHLRNRADSMVCYFFFNSLLPGNDKTSDAYRAILAQIVHQRSHNELLMDLFAFAMWSESHGQLQASPSEVTELLQLSLGILIHDNIYIILDGLDECADLARGLGILTTPRQELHSSNLIGFTRDTIKPYLQNTTLGYEIKIGQLNLKNIHCYFLIELRRLVNDQILPHDIDLGHVAALLSRRSDGMFLWASLMVQYLRSPELLISERLFAIREENMPENLDKMYSRILTLASKSLRRITRIKFILSWLYQSMRPINVAELEQALICSAGNVPGNPFDRFTNFQQDVVTICAGLVELSTTTPSNNSDSSTTIVKFIHSSVKEYLDHASHYVEKDGGVRRMLPSAQLANIHIARVCLQYLTYHVPAQQLSSVSNLLNGKSQLEDNFPLAQYAGRFWVQHALSISSGKLRSRDLNSDVGTEPDGLYRALRQFLSQPKAISAWIEATSIYSRPLPVKDIKKLARRLHATSVPAGRLGQSLDDLMLQFSKYLETVDENWAQHLLLDPVCVWEEVSAFHPSIFNEDVPGLSVEPLMAMEPSQRELWPKPISTVSQLISGTSMDIAISAFTTKAFMDCYSETKRHSELFGDLKFTSGWLLKVEIVDSDNPGNRMATTVPIDPLEVSLQLYQTLFLGSIHFPLSIRPRGTYFTCLRTVYKLTQLWPSIQYVTSIVPQDNDSQFKIDEYSHFQNPRTMSQVYLYWIYFHNNDRDLAVMEQVRNVPVALNIFRLAEKTPVSHSPELTRINRTLLPFRLAKGGFMEARSLDEKPFELAFHPSLPAIVAGSELGLYLWDYLSPLMFNIANSRRAKCISDQGWAWEKKSNKISFSTNGEILLIRSRDGTKRVNVRVYLAQISIPTGSISDISPVDSRDTGASTSEAVLGCLKASRAASVISLETIIHTRYGEVVAAVEKVEGKAELSLVYNGDHKNIHLTRIPNTDKNDTIEATAIMPKRGERSVKVVLDQGPKTWQSLAKINCLDDKAVMFPQVVIRDISTTREAEGITKALEGASEGVNKGKEKFNSRGALRDGKAFVLP
ncbi:hypothetical protein GGR51DRAFT_546874 [Nemania sp. FL0031]|nr:hypothetical protein GGR51DRAFT_546874 [Nemania sp. FL0031]